jgi:hypothetical protein
MTHTIDIPNRQTISGDTYYALRMPHGSTTQQFLVFTDDGRKRHVTRKREPSLVKREQAECALIDANMAEVERLAFGEAG